MLNRWNFVYFFKLYMSVRVTTYIWIAAFPLRALTQSRVELSDAVFCTEPLFEIFQCGSNARVEALRLFLVSWKVGHARFAGLEEWGLLVVGFGRIKQMLWKETDMFSFGLARFLAWAFSLFEVMGRLGRRFLGRLVGTGAVSGDVDIVKTAELYSLIFHNY